MALLDSSYLLIAKVNKFNNYVYHYNGLGINLESVLEEFWHVDYPDGLIDVDGSGLFPINVFCMPDDDGQIEKIFHFDFNAVAFHHYFDMGWSSSSNEPDKHYTFDQFLKDIEHKEPEGEKSVINLRVLEHDTCDQIRIGATFPAFNKDLDKVVENTKHQYEKEFSHAGTFNQMCEKYKKRVALVDAETLQSVREIWNRQKQSNA